jgi:hypothetical protein
MEDPARVGSERPKAETTPAVTEPCRPSGREVYRAYSYHGQIGQRIGADDLEGRLEAV